MEVRRDTQFLRVINKHLVIILNCSTKLIKFTRRNWTVKACQNSSLETALARYMQSKPAKITLIFSKAASP